MGGLLRCLVSYLRNTMVGSLSRSGGTSTIPHYAYGVILSLYVSVISLYACSALGLGFFIVIRRVSHYVTIDGGGHFTLLAPLAVALALLTPVMWRKASGSAKMATCAVLGSAVVMLGGFQDPLSLLVGLGLAAFSTIYMLNYSELVYRGFVLGWLSIIAFSATITILRTLGFPSTPRLTVADYLLGVLQHVSPHILLILAASPIPMGIASFLKLRGRPEERVETDPTDELRLVTYLALLSSLLYIVPYTAAVNPKGMVATTDILVYVDLLERMKAGENPLAAALVLNYGDRFLYLLLLYLVQRLTGADPWTIATISGWAWAPLLTASVWYMAKRLFNSAVALQAALLTPLSAQLLGFIYGGFQANHLNLSVMFFGLALLYDKSILKKLIGAVLISISPGIHMWSYVHLAPGLVLWSLAEVVRRRDKESIVRFVVLMAACSGSLLVVTRFVSSLDHIALMLEKWIELLAFSGQLGDKVTGLSLALAVYVWGSLNGPVLYLAGIGGQVMRLTGNRLSRMTPLDYIVATTFVGLLLLSPDIHLVSRLVLNVPFQVYAGIFLAGASKETKTLVYSTTVYSSIYLLLNAPP